MGDFGSDSDDSDGEGGMGNVSRVIMRPPGHSGKAKRGHLCFDASFETGNLGRVDLVSEFEYDLFIRPDTCSPKYRFWFNFTVDNVKQDQRVIFNIVNICKSRNLFCDHLTPLVKSTSRPKWQRIPKRHVYYHRSQVHKGHFILSFSFGFDKEDEVFQFALSFPYSYSRQQAYLQVLEKKAANLIKEDCFSREVIATSLQKRQVDMITFGNTNTANVKDKKRVVVILARIHPGESPSSFVCQGILEMLISSHPVAKVLREYLIIKVIPMLNPDGVFLGNYRSNLLGFDLNRSWDIISPWAHPTIHAVHDMLLAVDKNKEFQLDFIVDIHANMSLKGCFIHGNTYEDVYRCERHAVFPKLLAAKADDYATSNMMFNSDYNKKGTARRYFCSAINDRVNSYSFEVSISGYHLPDSKTFIPYTEDSYMRCGRNLLRTFIEYYKLTEVIPLNIFEEIMPKKKRRARTTIGRSSNRNISQRPKTTRSSALVHYTDININYDSSTSCDELPYSSRYYHSPRRQLHDTSRRSDICSRMDKSNQSPPLTFDIPPQPSLTIIDFNSITIGSLEEATKRNKYKHKI